MLNFLMPLLGNSGLGQDQISGVMNSLQDFYQNEQASNAQRLNVNPLRDLTPFKVNPSRGYLSFQGGGQVGDPPDTIIMKALAEGTLDDKSLRNVHDFMTKMVKFESSGDFPVDEFKAEMAKLGKKELVFLAPLLRNGESYSQILDRTSNIINSTDPILPDFIYNRLQQAPMKPLASFRMGGRTYESKSIPKHSVLIIGNDDKTMDELSKLTEYSGGDKKSSYAYVPMQFKGGGEIKVYGVEKAFLGKLLEGIGKGFKKVGQGAWEGIKGVADYALGVFGAPDVIDNTFIDRSKFLSGANNVMGSIMRTGMNIALPGVGTAIGALGNQLNQSVGGGSSTAASGLPSLYSGLVPQGSNYTNMGSMYNMINPMGMQAGLYGTNQPVTYNNPMYQSGMLPYSAYFGVPGLQSYGAAYRPPDPMLSETTKTPIFADGGMVGNGALQPIQAERVGKQPEMILHPNGMITATTATKRHAQMDDSEVTDILPEGSFIFSADKSMGIRKKDAADVLIGIKSYPYQEGQKAKAPEAITMDNLWKGKNKNLTPAELAEIIKKKYNILNYEELAGYPNDIFVDQTNKENLQSRMPYLANLVRMNEERRVQKTGETSQVLPSFKHGGSVLHINDVRHAPFGDFLSGVGSFLGNNAGTIATLAPALAGLLGRGNNTSQGALGIDPMVQAGILGTIPISQLGINQNIAAQQDALGQGIYDYSSLSNQLIADAAQSAQAQSMANLGNVGLGLTNQLMRDTNLEELNLGASRARLNNFTPRAATQAAVDAASTPAYDANAIMSQLGARSGPVIAQLMSDQQRAANQAAAQRNAQLDAFDMQRIQQLNQLDMTELPFNLQQREKEQMMREDQRNNVFGTLQGGVQRQADLQSGFLGQKGQIQSQILPTLTQLNLQRAQLAGQPNILGAQNALNAFSMLGSMQSQNATAGLTPSNLGGTGLSTQQLADIASRLQQGSAQALPGTPLPTSVSSTTSGGIPPLPTNMIPGLVTPTTGASTGVLPTGTVYSGTYPDSSCPSGYRYINTGECV